jgi:hypothetical protein
MFLVTKTLTNESFEKNLARGKKRKFRPATSFRPS